MSREPRKKWLWKVLNKIQNFRTPPYTPRYFWTRNKLVKDLLKDISLDPKSWQSKIAHPHYQWFCERIPEYSWVASKFAEISSGKRALDIGCVMNVESHLRLLLEKFEEVHFLNLVSEPLAMHGRISFHSQDLRTCDLKPQSFDLITSISTLEHIGGENSYNNFSINGTAELKLDKKSADWNKGLECCLKLLAPKGLLLVSLPFGIGDWVDGAYSLGKEDLSFIRQLARDYQKNLEMIFMARNEKGWIRYNESEFVQFHLEKGLGSNRVVLLEFK